MKSNETWMDRGRIDLSENAHYHIIACSWACTARPQYAKKRQKCSIFEHGFWRSNTMWSHKTIIYSESEFDVEFKYTHRFIQPAPCQKLWPSQKSKKTFPTIRLTFLKNLKNPGFSSKVHTGRRKLFTDFLRKQNLISCLRF